VQEALVAEGQLDELAQRLGVELGQRQRRAGRMGTCSRALAPAGLSSSTSPGGNNYIRPVRNADR